MDALLDKIMGVCNASDGEDEWLYDDECDDDGCYAYGEDDDGCYGEDDGCYGEGSDCYNGY